jgi:hypothetical protein
MMDVGVERKRNLEADDSRLFRRGAHEEKCSSYLANESASDAKR